VILLPRRRLAPDPEAMFNCDEVEALFEECKTEVKSQSESEFERMLCQVGIFLEQMYLQAEGQDVTIEVSPEILDDAKRIEGMKTMSFTSARLPSPTKKKGLQSLTSNAIDGKLVTKVNNLEQDKASLNDRIKKLSAQMREVMKKNTELQEKLQGAAATAPSSSSSSLEGLEAKLKAATNEISELKKSLDGKLAASKQFQSLKAMLTKKNKTIKELRAELGNKGEAVTIED